MSIVGQYIILLKTNLYFNVVDGQIDLLTKSIGSQNVIKQWSLQIYWTNVENDLFPQKRFQLKGLKRIACFQKESVFLWYTDFLIKFRKTSRLIYVYISEQKFVVINNSSLVSFEILVKSLMAIVMS